MNKLLHLLRRRLTVLYMISVVPLVPELLKTTTTPKFRSYRRHILDRRIPALEVTRHRLSEMQ